MEEILLPKISNTAGNKKYQNLALGLRLIVGLISDDSICSEFLFFFTSVFQPIEKQT